MKRNILLLTGNGFIGRNLIKSLNKNKNKISIFIKKENNFKIPKNIQVYKKNIFQIKEIQVKDSIIILTTLNNTNKDFKSKFSLLLNKIKSSKPKKLILISSVSVYSKKFNNYSRNCRIAEYECKKKFNNLIILRVGNIFGELRTKPSYIEKIIISLVNKLDFVENKLNLIRSYIYIGEFCRAISKVINNKTIKTNIYNLSNKNYIFSSNQVHKIVAECLNIKIFVKKKKISTHILKSIIKSNKFEKDFNFKFTNNFASNIKKIYKYYKKLS
jgi:nucleoside-diphosphate-sugar epimerase